MNAKLTYIFFLSLMVGLGSSCTSDSDVPDRIAPEEKAELAFSVSGLSRASVTTDISTPGSKFAVYGDRIFTDVPGAELETLFDKTEVEYVDNDWRYDDPQYWLAGHDHSFVAIYPLSIVAPENTPLYSGSKLSFKYAIPSLSGNEISKDDVTDIIGATHRRYYEPGDALPVSFRFTHLMTLINIAPALQNNTFSDEAYLQFLKIELTGLSNKADFSVLPAPRLSNNQTDDRVVEVTAQEGETKMTIEFANPQKIVNHSGNIALFDANDAIIMLPQIFAADSQAKITLTYTMNGNPDIMEVSSPLKLQKWESGKSYTYNFTLDGLRLILGSTSITDWDITELDSEATSE